MKIHQAKLSLLLATILSPLFIESAFARAPLADNELRYGCRSGLANTTGGGIAEVNYVAYRFKVEPFHGVQILNTGYIFQRQTMNYYRTTFFFVQNPIGVREGGRTPVRPPFPYVPNDAVSMTASGVGNEGWPFPQPTTFFWPPGNFARCREL